MHSCSVACYKMHRESCTTTDATQAEAATTTPAPLTSALISRLGDRLKHAYSSSEIIRLKAATILEAPDPMAALREAIHSTISDGVNDEFGEFLLELNKELQHGSFYVGYGVHFIDMQCHLAPPLWLGNFVRRRRRRRGTPPI